MRLHRGIWIAGTAAACLASAAVGVHPSSAAPSGAATRASTIDGTYSCRVRRQHFVLLSGTVTMGQQQPGLFDLISVNKSVVKNGATVTVTQFGFSAPRSNLHVDKSTCSRVKKQIPLKSKGLSGPPETVTPSFEGHLNQRCNTKDRVLVRIRLTTSGGHSTHALVAVRNDDAKHKPVAFWNWSPQKLSSWSANGCVDVS